MATGKVIGKIEVSSIGNVKIIGVDGSVRDAVYDGLMYEGEQLVSNDPETLFQIKYLALPEATVYEGVFGVLADGSVIADVSELEALFGDDIDFMETAAGGGEADSNSGIPEDAGIFAESSVQDFYRGENGEVGLGITASGVGDSTEDQTPPVITSSNVVIFDENDTNPVIQVMANDTSNLSFSLNEGLDSALFSINPTTGVLTFNNPPDYETPLDIGADNEYNVEVTVTDAFGNYTTQFISVSINNLNDNTPTAEDETNYATEDVYDDGSGHSATGQLVGGDADGNEIKFVLVDNTSEGHVTLDENGHYSFDVGGDFQDLAFGETREVTFTYQTTEVGPPLSEPSDAGPFTSETATVTITVTGTNDQPVVSDIDANGSNSLNSWLLGASTESVENGDFLFDTNGASEDSINALFNVGEESVEVGDLFVEGDQNNNPTDGAALKVTVDVQAGETVMFNWTFNDAEGYDGPPTYEDGYNDFGFVVIDGETIQLLANSFDNGDTNSGMFSYTFTEGGQHEITFGVMNDDDTVVDSSLQVTYIAGGTIVDLEHVGYMEDMSINSESSVVFETTSSGNPLVDTDSSDVYTTFDGNLATAVDLDTSDTHTYHLVQGSVAVDSMPTQIGVVVDADGEYHVSGDFNYLAAGETSVVTFQYYADDGEGFGATGDGGANEASFSELKTVTLTITGTNDAPIAVADTGTTTENVAVTIDVLANDTDVDNGAVLTLDEVSVEEGNGSVSIVGNELLFNPGTDFDYLAVGETATVEVAYTMSDEHGASSSSTTTITVTGTNDAPIISESDVLFVNETAGFDNILVAYTLDEDGNPINPVVAVIDTNSGYATGSLMSSLNMPASEIHFALIADGQSIYPNITDAVLTFDTSGAFPQLLINGSVSAKPVYFDQNNFNPDGHDHFDSVDNHDGTITINMEDLNLGDNDRQDLVITLVDNTVGEVTELTDGDESENLATLTATGALSFDDADLSDTHTVSATPTQADYLGNFSVDINPAATGSQTGQINWNYSVNDADLDHLAQGEILTQVYTITVDDGHGGTDTQDITITINGTNDAPTINIFGGENLIVNGSFEGPDVEAGTWSHFASENVAGWTASDQIEIWDHLGNYTPSDGEQHAELDYDSAIDSLSQTLELEAGKFMLVFDAATRDAATKDNAFNVLWNGQTIAEITEDDMSNSDGTWKTFTFEVDAVDGANTLTFIEPSSDNYGPLLDNIQLYSEVSSASLNETLTGEIVVGQVFADDVDNGAVLSYSLDNDYGLFDVRSDGAVVLKEGASLDYENNPSYTLEVRVTDEHGASDMKTLEIDVGNIIGVVTTVDETLVSQDFSHWNNEGWSWNGWEYMKNELGRFHEGNTVHREFNLGEDHANQEVRVEFDLNLHQPDGFFHEHNWESNDAVHITANDVTQTQYGTSGDGTYHISMQVIADDDGKVDMSLVSDTHGAGHWFEVWSLDNFEISSNDQVISFDNSSDGTINMEELLSQSNDFDLNHDGTVDSGTPDSVDEIDLSVGNHTLSNITLSDVLDITDGDNVLKITGDSADGVNDLANNGWVIDTSPSVSETGYDTYTNVDDTSVQLLIDIDIPVDSD